MNEKEQRAIVKVLKLFIPCIVFYALILLKWGDYNKYPILEIVIGIIIAFLGVYALIIYYEALLEEEYREIRYKKERLEVDNTEMKEKIKKFEERLWQLKQD